MEAAFLWHVGEDNCKEAIATWYIMVSSICLLALIGHQRSETYVHMPFSGTIIEQRQTTTRKHLRTEKVKIISAESSVHVSS